MRAAVLHAARDLRIEERPVAEPGPRQVRVRIANGGICGSDLHYYFEGGIGDAIRLREPMILGHEVAGTVDRVGEGVTAVSPGDRVALDPSRPCAACRYCLAGTPNHCLHMRFYGSAMPMPHVQGAFADVVIAEAAQCVTVPDDLPLASAAMAEPLAVCLHAVRRAGPVLGGRVLVTGQGPIGVLAVAAARAAGAAEIVATDLVDEALAVSRRMGADRAVNVATESDALAGDRADKGRFDVLLEASGNEAAIRGALEAVRPGGVMVQIGLGGEATLPLNTIVAKELELRGTFRFHEEFRWAVDCIATGRIDVAPLLTEIVPLAEADRAFELAIDRRRAMKVQLAFAG